MAQRGFPSGTWDSAKGGRGKRRRGAASETLRRQLPRRTILWASLGPARFLGQGEVSASPYRARFWVTREKQRREKLEQEAGEARIRVWGQVGGRCHCNIFFVEFERGVLDPTYCPRAESWLSLVPRAPGSLRPLAQPRGRKRVGSARARLPPSRPRGLPPEGSPGGQAPQDRARFGLGRGRTAVRPAGRGAGGQKEDPLPGPGTVRGTCPRASEAFAVQGPTAPSTFSRPGLICSAALRAPNAILG